MTQLDTTQHDMTQLDMTIPARRTFRNSRLVGLVGASLMTMTLIAGCGNSGESTAGSTTSSTTAPTTSSTVAGATSGDSSGTGSGAVSTTTSTSSTTAPGGGSSGGCPVGRYRLESPGSGLPIQITTGGTGVVVEVGSDDRVRISYDEYATASGTARGGSFTISARGAITARLEPVPGADNQYRLADVDGSAVTGEERIAIDGGEPIVIAGAEFTDLVGGLGGVGAGATLSCSSNGDLVATAGPITQTYVRM